jgi:hypothetical protein
VRLQQGGGHAEQVALDGVGIDQSATEEVVGAARELRQACAEQTAGARFGDRDGGSAGAQDVGDDLLYAAVVGRKDGTGGAQRRRESVGLGSRLAVSRAVTGDDGDLAAGGGDGQAQTVGGGGGPPPPPPATRWAPRCMLPPTA